MTTNEIRAEIEKVERAIFYEEMADFMNWTKYYELKAKKEKLAKQLKEMEG